MYKSYIYYVIRRNFNEIFTDEINFLFLSKTMNFFQIFKTNIFNLTNII